MKIRKRIVATALLGLSVFGISLEASAELSEDEKSRIEQLVFNPLNGLAEPLEIAGPGLGAEPVAYVWRLVSPSLQPLANNVNQIVYVPGFEIDDPTAATQSDPGTLDSLYEIVDQLRYDGTVVGDTDLNNKSYFLEYLARNRSAAIHVIEFVENTDSISNNSEVLQGYISSPVFNNNIGTSNPVMFGYSMGGVIARHALLGLESNGLGHGFGGYVSLDAPHRGAFLPPSLEVSVRTLRDRVENDPSGELKPALREAVSLLNSKAARQLMGIHIGKPVPRYEALKPTGWEVRNNWLDYQTWFNQIQNNNFLARDPMFFELREELIDMGGYPSLPLNIGVSFGRADGAQIMNPADRSTFPAKIRAEIGTNFGIMTNKLYSIRNPISLCDVKWMIERTQRCPALHLIGQDLESIFVSPGSTITPFANLANEVEVDTTDEAAGLAFYFVTPAAGAFVGPAAAFGTLSIGYAYSAGMKDDNFYHEKELTFIPTVSSFDATGRASTFPGGAPLSAIETPFDVIIADSGLDVAETGEHDTITETVVLDVFDSLADADAFSRQKMRIGGDNYPGSPNSTYWSLAGDFDVIRYISQPTIRDLPVVSNATTASQYDLRPASDVKISAVIPAAM